MNQAQVDRLCRWYPGDISRRAGTSTELMLYAIQLCSRITELKEFPSESHLNRWLGFLQGLLYAASIYTTEDLTRHNNQAQHGDDFT